MEVTIEHVKKEIEIVERELNEVIQKLKEKNIYYQIGNMKKWYYHFIMQKGFSVDWLN